MLMFDLPQDLIEEVFSRVPATTLIRLRTTCKLWNALLKNTSFTEKHFLKAPKQSLMIRLKDDGVCSMRVNLNVVSPSIEFKEAPILIDSRSNSEQVCILEVFHCVDGLLLCITTEEDRLVVWNPCLGETKWIQLKTVYDDYSKFVLGYENNKSCRNYKILRFWDYYYCKSMDSFVGFEIYDFRTDSWRVLDGCDVSLEYIILGNGCVSLKGNSYWSGFDKQNRCKLILRFDFTSERFEPMYLPTSMNPSSLTWYCRSLSVVREEQLSTSQRNICSRKLEIWVTNNIETATETTLSWTKSFTISDSCSVFSSLLVNEEKKVVVCCTVNHVTRKNIVCVIGEDDKYYTEIPLEISWRTTLIFSYVPSLVQIQQTQEAKEKTEIN